MKSLVKPLKIVQEVIKGTLLEETIADLAEAVASRNPETLAAALQTTEFHSSVMSGVLCAQKPQVRGILSVKNHATCL